MGEYLGYLNDSEEYKNLLTSRDQMEEIKESLGTLLEILNENTDGNVVNEYKAALSDIKDKIKDYADQISNRIDKLELNAGKGDAVLESWRSKTDYVAPYTTVTDDDAGHISTKTIYQKVDNVGRSEGDNYIKVTVRKYDETYFEDNTTTPPTSTRNVSENEFFDAKYNFSGEKIS